MELSNRNKAIIVGVSLATAFVIGRYTVPEKVKIETKIVEVEKKSTDSDVGVKTDKHKKVTITKTTKPDGEKTVTITKTDDDSSDVNVNNKQTTQTTTDKDTLKEITAAGSKLTISALAGFDLGTMKPTYGASFTKPILGPITIGGFILSNGSCGGSLGLTF